ncbi:FUSC family protein [Zhouia amylolytica]|uniref:FUSC family protein n=1 Tax=Zhouia amylolytica TaxID=376730 RepID=UPI0020CCB08E|nr:FUSC family protein [Zhouia amylolytica]MCQ0111154.1 FUSC family protein [Zhouia amylolytica]
MLKEVTQFFKSFQFAKGLLITLAAVTAIAISYFAGKIEMGASLAFGVLLTSVPDIPGNTKHKLYGVLAAIIFAVINIILINLTYQNYILISITLLVLVFFYAYISVYGFRASLVSLSGLLAIAISMAHLRTGHDIILHAGVTALGGLWYLLLSTAYSLINPTQFSMQLLSEVMRLTADYLNTRAELILVDDSERKELLKKLFQLQTELNEKHESLRSVLLNARIKSGSTNYIKKQLMVFIELIDMLELAIANPMNYKTIDKNFKKDNKNIIKSFAAISQNIAIELEILSVKISKKNGSIRGADLDTLLATAHNDIENYKASVDVEQNRDKILLLRNLYDYIEQQAEKIKNIKRVLTITLKQTEKEQKSPNKKLLTPQDYSINTLKENLSFKSPIFKHSLRLTITVLAGFLIGSLFSIQNAYWIILTIIVIMRPNYGLTKERSKQRIAGTLIGGLIAVAIIVLTQNIYVYIAIILVSMTMGFSFIQQNYKASATFITLNIVFVYALLQPNAFEVIQYRIIDTLIGAGLAIVANYTLWPAWEFYYHNDLLIKSIESNINYLKEVKSLYNNKEGKSTSYVISRKEAFLAIGNLMATFQRMAQEPKSKQKNFMVLYEAVVIQHTFLSSTAAIGTYIQNHHTSSASNDFNDYIDEIIKNLNESIQLLKGNHIATSDSLKHREAINQIKSHYAELIKKRQEEISLGNLVITEETRSRLKEAHLVIDLLQYLFSLSEKLKKLVGTN